MKKQISCSMSAFCLIFALFAASLPTFVVAQGAAQTQTIVAPEYAAQLAKIEEKLEARRAELGIPGAALAIVKDDKIILLKGFGYKDFLKKLPVTPDTQFAIGSSSKAFTGLSVMMSQDAGKLSIDDSPKKYLPYFKINDAEIDSKITVRDLLAHSSGLNRTDLAWVSGKLNREEIIKVAGEARPTAKLREKFQYQNVMFTAAGETVARANRTTWEKYVAENIFKPLGMTNSNLAVKDMQKSKDFSLGYDYNPNTKETRNLPTRDLTGIEPAGSINSSARDMTNWLRLMLNGGVAPNGKRLVSEAGFAEIVKPQMKISPNGKVNYGFGWFLQEWQGNKVVQHGGNIDGFNAMVAFVPEKKTGFVLLTNVTASSLTGEMMSVVWENLLAAPKTENAVAATGKIETEAGKYRFPGADLDIEVKALDGKLTALVPGQPVYVLENVGARRYKLADGFFITFKDSEAYLEQPHGNFTLPRVKPDGTIETKAATATVKELIGKYAAEKAAQNTVEIAEKEGKVSLVVGAQPPYELRDKARDVFNSPGLPETYSVKAQRDASGKINGIVLVQPEGEFAFNLIGAANATTATDAPKLTVDELMSKVIQALGGEANWRKLTTRVTTFDLDLVHQGVKGFGTQYAKAPNLSAGNGVFTALGKQIGETFQYFDGKNGAEYVSFAPADVYSGKQLEDARLNSDFYGLLNWKTLYPKVELKGAQKLGEETVYAVAFEPEKGNKDTYYFSAKTFLPIKLDSFNNVPTAGIDMPYSETFSDYRIIDGVMIPFKTVNSSVSSGDVVTILKEVKHNVSVDDEMFQPKN